MTNNIFVFKGELDGKFVVVRFCQVYVPILEMLVLALTRTSNVHSQLTSEVRNLIFGTAFKQHSLCLPKANALTSLCKSTGWLEHWLLADAISITI